MDSKNLPLVQPLLEATHPKEEATRTTEQVQVKRRSSSSSSSDYPLLFQDDEEEEQDNNSLNASSIVKGASEPTMTEAPKEPSISSPVQAESEVLLQVQDVVEQEESEQEVGDGANTRVEEDDVVVEDSTAVSTDNAAPPTAKEEDAVVEEKHYGNHQDNSINCMHSSETKAVDDVDVVAQVISLASEAQPPIAATVTEDFLDQVEASLRKEQKVSAPQDLANKLHQKKKQKQQRPQQRSSLSPKEEKRSTNPGAPTAPPQNDNGEQKQLAEVVTRDENVPPPSLPQNTKGEVQQSAVLVSCDSNAPPASQQVVMVTPPPTKKSERVVTTIRDDVFQDEPIVDGNQVEDTDDEMADCEDDDDGDEADDDTATQPETPEKDEFLDGDEEDGKQSVAVSLDLVEQGKATSVGGSKKSKKSNITKVSPQKKTKKKKSSSPSGKTTNGKKHERSTKKQRQDKTESARRSKCRFRCTLCFCCVLSLFLMGCIATLGYTLYAVKNEQEPSFFGIDLSEWFREMVAKINGEEAPTVAPVGSTSLIDADPNILAMVRDTLLQASNGNGTIVPGMVPLNTVLDDPTTLQYSVLAWLANDPSLSEYSSTKILQRYALGCFYWSLQDVKTDRQVLDTWMTYGDECDFWKTTGGLEAGTITSLCDETSGQVASIHLENVYLSGTLAPELALLSNSLEMIYLTENYVSGTIPSSFGRLTMLKRIQISRNRIQGSIPPELGMLQERLEVLSLGRNDLSGTVPPELGLLTKLMELNLAENSLTGDIPPELKELDALTILRLEDNNIGGTVPNEMCNRTTADPDTAAAEEAGLRISVDCEEVKCSCCVDCCFYCGLGSNDNTAGEGANEQTSSVTAAVPPTAAPSKDPLVYPVAPTPATNFDCYSAEVGFSCYNPQYAIDFETTACNPQTYDMTAVFAMVDGSTSLVGTQQAISNAAVWAKSCTLPDCDGVISDGSVYYRNIIPDRSKEAVSWPLPIGTTFILATVHVDASGMATILAQSTPFLVANLCP